MLELYDSINRTLPRNRAARVVGAAALAVIFIAFAGTAHAGQAPRWDGGRLVGFAEVIVTGRVVDVRAGRDPVVNTIYTYVTVDVSRTLRGAVSTHQIIVKQLGGEVAGRGLRVHDQPSFAVGEDVLLFLEVRPRDRSLYTVAGWQGKWLLEQEAGAPIAVRAAAGDNVRDRWRLDLVRRVIAQDGAAKDAGKYVNAHPADASGAVAQPFVIFSPAFRFNFSPVVDVQTGGQPGLAGGGVSEILNSILRWNRAGSAFAFVPGSVDGPARCFNAELRNSRVTISFNDPCGEIDDNGGTLAVGGAYYNTSGGAFVNGVFYYEATEGFVVNNDGPTAAPFLQNSNCFSDIQLHELGHVLGLDHSNVFGAIMYPTLSGSCVTGARALTPDDIQGLLTIYPATGGITPPGSAPTNVSVSVNGLSSITVSFNPVTADIGFANSAATAYRLDFATTPTGPAVYSVQSSTAPVTIAIPAGLSGTFYVSVTGLNSAGSGPSSPRVAFAVGACLPPATPTGLATNFVSGTAAASWNQSLGATNYVVQAGTAPGASDFGTAELGNVTAIAVSGLPAGFRAYVRVFAANACGASAPTPDVRVQ